MADQFGGAVDGLMFDELADMAAEQLPPGFGEEDVLADAGDACEGEQTDADPQAEEPGAAERLDRLFEHMKAYRRQLLSIIELCAQPQLTSVVGEHVRKLQRHAVSAFTPEGLCALLVEAGGLAWIDAEGNPFDPAKVEPREVVVDGVTYYEVPEEPVETFYHSTDEALALLGQDDKVGRANALLEERGDFAFAIAEILEMAASPQGTQIKAIEDVVLKDPRFKGSQWRPNSFLNKLEEADAVAWDGSWKITGFGRELLENIQSSAMTGDAVKAALDL